MKTLVAALMYVGGIEIISASLNLGWWIGFGIWLTGLGLMLVIVSES